MSNTQVVIGGAGFIGSHLVDALLTRGDKVIVIDNLFSGSLNNLVDAQKNNRFKFIEVDIKNHDKTLDIFLEQEIDTIFNLATAGLLRSLQSPEWCCLEELIIAQECCYLIRHKLARKLVHFSTSEVYGESHDLPLKDSSRKLPTTPYAVGKNAADNLIKVMIDLFDINAVIIRPFNNFGYRQRNFEYQGIIPRAIRLLNASKPVTIYGDGTQTRDFIYVEDMLIRLFMILDYHFDVKNKYKNIVYQICSGQDIRILDLVRLIAEIGDFKCNITFEKERLGDIQCLLGVETCIDKIYPDLTPINESIEFLINKEKQKCE